MGVFKSLFGYLPNGRAITKYTLQQENGIACAVLDYGGIIAQLWVPDANGNLADVVCGFDSASYFGMRFKEVVGCTPGEYRRRVK